MPYSTLLYHRAPRRSRASSKIAISAETEYTLFCIKSCHELEAAYGAASGFRQLVPDRNPGHAFIVIVHPGWRRHTKV